jgi:hypothetical protein
VDKDAAAIVGEFEGLVRIKDESLYHSLSWPTILVEESHTPPPVLLPDQQPCKNGKRSTTEGTSHQDPSYTLHDCCCDGASKLATQGIDLISLRFWLVIHALALISTCLQKMYSSWRYWNRSANSLFYEYWHSSCSLSICQYNSYAMYLMHSVTTGLHVHAATVSGDHFLRLYYSRNACDHTKHK